MVARPTKYCKCSGTEKRRGRMKLMDDFTRAPRFGWWVHAKCRRPARAVVDRFIYNMTLDKRDLLDELRKPDQERPVFPTTYKVPDMPVGGHVKVQLGERTAIQYSRTDPAKKYLLVHDGEKWTCPCQGYGFRQTCVHAEDEEAKDREAAANTEQRAADTGLESATVT